MGEHSPHIREELERLPGDAADAQRCLEVAAILGPAIDLDEWRRACEIGGLRLHDKLAERGLVRGDDGGWRFADPTLRARLIEEADRAGRSRSHHAACARALFVMHPDRESGISARRASHLCEAGLFEEALRPLRDAAKEAFDSGEMDDAREFLDLHDHLLDELGVGCDAPSRAQSAWRRAWVHHTMGERDLAMELVEQSRRVLEGSDWIDDLGHIALLIGRIHRDRGHFEDARGSFDEAISHFASAGDDHGLATSRASRGFIELQIGEHRRARHSFCRALTSFEGLEDDWMVASLLNMIAQTWLIVGNTAEATECVKRARQVARAAGHRPNEAAAWMIHGEMARSECDWEEAKRCYRAAAELYGDDNRSIHVTQFNLALAEVGAKDFDAAAKRFEELEHLYPKVGLGTKVPLVCAGLMACAAGVADWKRFSRYHARTVALIDEFSSGHHDIAWMASEAMRLADAHGNLSVKHKCAEIACAQFERLGQDARADELRASLVRELA